MKPFIFIYYCFIFKYFEVFFLFFYFLRIINKINIIWVQNDLLKIGSLTKYRDSIIESENLKFSNFINIMI